LSSSAAPEGVKGRMPVIKSLGANQISLSSSRDLQPNSVKPDSLLGPVELLRFEVDRINKVEYFRSFIKMHNHIQLLIFFAEKCHAIHPINSTTDL